MSDQSDIFIPEPIPVEPGDENIGTVVVVINGHGVAVAYGPYAEMEAHALAEFLVPVCLATWCFVLDEHDQQRYGEMDLRLRESPRPRDAKLEAP